MSEAGGDVITPELALVDPVLAEAQRQAPERKVTMSSNPPGNGTFFIDPDQPTPGATEEPSAAPPPLVAAPAEAPETPEPAPAPPAAAKAAAPTHNVPLGTLIFRAGLLAEEQLEDALQEGMRTGKRLGEVLLERGWLHERDLGRLLAAQKGLDFVTLDGTQPDPAALQMLPEEKAKLQAALPLRFEDGQLVVAVADPSNDLMLENLRRAVGYEPQLVVAAHGELMSAIDAAYRDLAPAVSAPEPVAETPPEPAPESAPEPAVPSLQPEPPPAVTPMPTVLPPAEDRGVDAVAPAPLITPPVVAAPVAEPQAPPEPAAPAEEAPVAETAPQPPPAPVEQAPVAEPPPLQPPVAPVEEAPAPIVEPPPLQPPVARVEAAPVAEPPPLQPPAAAPIQPLHEAAPPVAPPPEAAPPPPPEAVEPAPAAVVEPVAAPPVEPQPLVEQPPAVEPVAETPAPPAETPEAPAVPVAPVGKMTHFVVLRLRDGEQLEIGSHATAAEAKAQAEEVVHRIASAEAGATWPLFAERYLRPDAIVSVDVLEESADKWMGSAVRSRWAHEA